MKIELQVNLKFGKGVISGCGTMKDGAGNITTVLYYASSVPHLLRKIKKTSGVNQEDVTLTFQP